MVKQVNATLAGSYEVVMVNDANGQWVADVRPLIRCGVSVIVEQNGRRETGYSGGGGRFSYAELLEKGLPEQYVNNAVRQGLINLEV